MHTSPGGSKTVSVVVAVNYTQKVITLLRLKAKRNEGSGHDDISFHEVTLNASQLQQQLELLDAEEEGDCLLDDYGICGECRGVFRVAQGDKQFQYANEDKIAVLQKELQLLSELKQRLAREKAYERALGVQKTSRRRQSSFLSQSVSLSSSLQCSVHSAGGRPRYTKGKGDRAKGEGVTLY